MPKFNIPIDKLETRFEKWMYVLKNLPRLQKLPIQFQERIFEKIFQVAEIAKMKREEITEYEDSLKKYRDMFSVIETAKDERTKEIALKMFADGVSIDIICKYTGLSIQQIEEIINPL